jgi:hypothetical protein
LEITVRTPFTNLTVNWAALLVASSAIDKVAGACFTIGLVNQVALSAHKGNSLTSGSTRSTARTVVTPFSIHAWSLRTRRRILALNRAEEGASTVIAAWNTTARFVVNNCLLQPSSGVGTTAIALRVFIRSHCAIHRAARGWWIASNFLYGLGTRSTTGIRRGGDDSGVSNDSTFSAAIDWSRNATDQFSALIC